MTIFYMVITIIYNLCTEVPKNGISTRVIFLSVLKINNIKPQKIEIIKIHCAFKINKLLLFQND